jgi:hypothetical protein
MKRAREENIQSRVGKSCKKSKPLTIGLLDLPVEILLIILEFLVIPKFDFPFPYETKDRHLLQIFDLSLHESMEILDFFVLLNTRTFELFRKNNPVYYGNFIKKILITTHHFRQMGASIHYLYPNPHMVANSDVVLLSVCISRFIEAIKTSQPTYCQCVQQDCCYGAAPWYATGTVGSCINGCLRKKIRCCAARKKLLVGPINWLQIAKIEAIGENRFYGLRNDEWVIFSGKWGTFFENCFEKEYYTEKQNILKQIDNTSKEEEE